MERAGYTTKAANIFGPLGGEASALLRAAAQPHWT
jgi:hypothetical protein